MVRAWAWASDDPVLVSSRLLTTRSVLAWHAKRAMLITPCNWQGLNRTKVFRILTILLDLKSKFAKPKHVGSVWL